jgi:hypothetical protein
LTTPIWIAIGVAHAIAVADVWASRLTRPAKVLWTLTVLCLFGVGLAAWLITRNSAYQEEVAE